MDELSPVNGESLLVRLVSDTVSDPRAKHHLVAAHEVSHNVLQSRFKRLRIHQVKVDLIISGDLNPFVTFDKKYEASSLYFIVLLPFLNDVPILVLFLEYPKEHHFAGATCNEGLIVEQIHLPQVHIGHLLKFNLLSVISIHLESLPLSIERVYHILISVIEALIREVFRGASHLHFVELALNLPCGVIVYEVVMGEVVVIEQLDEDSVVSDERTSAKWVCEALDRHRKVIDTQGFIDVEFLFLDDLWGPLFFAHQSEPELTVIDVNESILVALVILFNFFAPNEAVRLSTDLLIKCLFVRLKVVHADPELSVILLRHQNGPG